MMRRHSVATPLFLMVFCYCGAVYGQSKTTLEVFPTYQQIRPTNAEIIDYTSPKGTQDLPQQRITLRLFDYPAGTVTYTINSDSTTNGTRDKASDNKKGNPGMNMRIKPQPGDGKRTIRVN